MTDPTRSAVLGVTEVPAPKPEVSEQGVWHSGVVTRLGRCGKAKPQSSRAGGVGRQGDNEAPTPVDLFGMVDVILTKRRRCAADVAR